MEYWNREKKTSHIRLKDSTDTIGVLKQTYSWRINSYGRIPPIQLEYWNLHFYLLSLCIAYIPPIQLEYWNNVGPTAKITAELDTIPPIQLEYWNIGRSRCLSPVSFIPPIQLEYWNPWIFHFSNHCFPIPPIQLEYWNAILDAKIEEYKEFHRYNWSIETIFLIVFHPCSSIIFHRYNWSIETCMEQYKWYLMLLIPPIQLEYWNTTTASTSNAKAHSTDTIGVLKLKVIPKSWELPINIPPIQLEYWNF